MKWHIIFLRETLNVQYALAKSFFDDAETIHQKWATTFDECARELEAAKKGKQCSTK